MEEEMITLDCPVCESPIEFTFAADEDWAHRPCAEIDEVIKECSCVLTKEQSDKLDQDALIAAEDFDPY
jgi:hypothetical protein